MAKQIDVDTLREWLDDQQPVTVVDVRTDDGKRFIMKRELTLSRGIVVGLHWMPQSVNHQ